MEVKIENLIKDFLEEKAAKICPNKEKQRDYKYEIYNEFSLQHELGIYLRNKLNKDKDNTKFKVLFEKNVKPVCGDNEPDGGWKKHEIDITIVKKNGETWEPCTAIELKFPTNGQYPEQMKAFITDMEFMKQLYDEKNDIKTYCLTLVNDKNFYETSGREDPKSENYENYMFFRTGATKNDLLPKIKWNELKKIDDKNSIWYYLIDIKGRTSVDFNNKK